MFVFPPLSQALAALAGTAGAMLALDGVWLGLVAFPFYRARIGHLLAPNPDFATAALFYALYCLGVLVFAVFPVLAASQTAVRALLVGACLGLVAYGTYDLTNQATLRDWPLAVTLVDMAWGAFITAVAAAAGVLVAGWFK